MEYTPNKKDNKNDPLYDSNYIPHKIGLTGSRHTFPLTAMLVEKTGRPEHTPNEDGLRDESVEDSDYISEEDTAHQHEQSEELLDDADEEEEEEEEIPGGRLPSRSREGLRV